MATVFSRHLYEVVIVGGSNAGLSAALTLGRALRRVFICDTGKSVNARAQAAHGFFTRDGTPPAELLRIAREQLHPYDTVETRLVAIADATRDGGDFALTLADGNIILARTMLLATGATPVFLAITGVAERWGESVNQYPFCHGWEVRDVPLAVNAADDHGFDYALTLANWSRDLFALTNGPAAFTDAERAMLAAREIRVHEERVVRLEGPGRTLTTIVLADGTRLPRAGLFLAPLWRQHSDLAACLGCALTPDGSVQVDAGGATSVAGVYAAGDTAHLLLQNLAIAVADGVRAAATLNHALTMRGVAR